MEPSRRLFFGLLAAAPAAIASSADAEPAVLDQKSLDFGAKRQDRWIGYGGGFSVSEEH